MRKQDWQGAFGAAPRSFDNRVDYALDKIRREEYIVKKKIISGALAAALGIVAIGGAALAAANSWNVFDFINNYQFEVVQPGMSDTEKGELMQKPEVKVTTEHATATLQDAVFDGMSAHVTLLITPNDDKTLLLPEWYSADDPVQGQDNANYYDVKKEGAEKNYVTYAEKAESEGKQIVYVGAHITGSNTGNEAFNDDGSLTIYLEAGFDKIIDGEHTFEMDLCERAEGATDFSDKSKQSFTLTTNTAVDMATAQGEYKLGYLTVTDIEYTRSKLGAKVKISGKLSDDITSEQLKELETITITEWLNADTRLEGTGGSFGIFDDAGEAVWGDEVKGGMEFTAVDSLAAGEKIPESLMLKIYNYDKGEYGANVEIPLIAKAD